MPGGHEFRDYENVDFDLNGYTVQPGMALSIRQPKNSPGGSGDVSLVEAENSRLRVESDDEIRMKRRGDDLVLIVTGDCTIYIPTVLASVSCRLFDGDISASDLTVAVTANTMSGDISLENVVFGSACVTMSGDIQLRATEFRESSCEVTSMSGDIALGIPDSWNGTVKASTMSGSVDVNYPSAKIEDRSGFVGSSIVARIGESAENSKLRCTTMSGDIDIESVSTSDAKYAKHS